jgi:hypothetical protein
MSHRHLPINPQNKRPLGNHPAPQGFRAPVREARPKLIPESQWIEFELDPGPIKVKDQDGRGACNGFAAATSLEWKRHLQGLPYVALSGWYVYAILCNGIDRGSSIDEALSLLVERGCGPESEVNYGIINPGKLTAKAHAEAKRFTLEIGARRKTFAELMTATQLRRPFNFSISAGQSGFNRLDADGCPSTSGGTGDHAVTGGLGAKKCKDGQWAIKWQNSWSTQWGQDGFAWFKERHIRGQGWFDSYDIVAVGADPTDPAPVLR